MAIERSRRARPKPDSLDSLRKKAKERPAPTPEEIARQERGREAALRNHGTFDSPSQRRTRQRLEAAEAEGEVIAQEVEERRSMADLLKESFDSLPDMSPDRKRSVKELAGMEDQHLLGDAESTDDIKRWGPKSKRRYFEANNRADYRPLRAGAPQKRGPWRGAARRIELASLGSSVADIEKRLGKSTEIDGRAAWPQEDGSVVVFDSYGLGQEPRPIIIAPRGVHTFYSPRGAERVVWHAADRRFIPAPDAPDAGRTRPRSKRETSRSKHAEPGNTQLRDALNHAIESFKRETSVPRSEQDTVGNSPIEHPGPLPMEQVHEGGDGDVPDLAAERNDARERRRMRRRGKHTRGEGALDGE